MFWKYIFPVVLGIILTLLFRGFVEYDGTDREWHRIPRIAVLISIGMAFIPIFNYVVDAILLILFIMILFVGGEGEDFKIRELKDNKFNRWLFKS